MLKELILRTEIMHAKMGYILSCLSSYSSLDLSKRLKKINNCLYLIVKSLKEGKEYIDVRDVVELKEEYYQLKNKVSEDDNILLEGHKIACLLFEFSKEMELLVLLYENNKINSDIIEFLTYVNKITFICARIVNIQILCFENKF